jgi:eukaryotic-like serine/threonine-protein kinase
VPIVQGSRIGAYEIAGHIGSGGMGEVYRARDHRLQRDVAIKVLPTRLSGDADRAARFEREARTLASINHPNIAIVHGFEDLAGSPALVMELVEGPTLADRIARGALATDEAIAIAAQIADALEAAHEQGIIHRDLKPSNVKVRPDGTVKVLDFGLAKALAVANDPAESDVADSPTVTAHGATRDGIVLGTAAYMSPEQARGRGVDKRADIWAFGCVLYEMLAGRAAFAGETMTDVLAAVIQRDPDWTQLPRDLPRSVVALLGRCLQKNPRERLRDIGDARIDLRAAQAPGSDPEIPVPQLKAPFVRQHRLWLAAAGFALGAAVTGAMLYVLGLRDAAPPAPARTARMTVTLPPETTLALGRGSSVALSPDGRTLVYAVRTRDGEIRLYTRALDRFDSTVLPGTEDAADPFFSPDGRWVGFFAQGKLKKVSLGGGAPVTIAEVLAPRGEAWTPDDTILVTPANNKGISRVSPGGGPLTPLTTLKAGEMSHRWPHVLGDGSAVVFTIWNDTGWEPAKIAAQRIGSSDHTVIVESGGGFPRALRDPETGRSYLVYARSEGLLAAPFDAAALKITGQPVPVIDGVFTNLSGGAHFDLSETGTLAYISGTLGEVDRDLTWVTHDGKATLARRLAAMGRPFALSPDGNRVVRHNTVGQRSVWIEDLARGTSLRLTNGEGNFSPVWSADGTWIAFPRGVPTGDIYRRRADQSGEDERLTATGRGAIPTDFSPDSRLLAYTENDPSSGADIWTVTLPPPGTKADPSTLQPRPFRKTGFSESRGVFSRDGRWLAYQSNESGRFEVYLRSFPDGERAVQVSTDGGLEPTWSQSGELFYRGINGMVMAVTIALTPALRVDKPRALFDGRGYENIFQVSPDGRRLLMMPRLDNELSVTQVNVVLDFLSELRQRVK